MRTLVLEQLKPGHRITIDDDEIGQRARLDDAKLALHAQDLGADERRLADDLNRPQHLAAQDEFAAKLNIARNRVGAAPRAEVAVQVRVRRRLRAGTALMALCLLPISLALRPAVGGVVATIGFALLNVAIAFAVSTLFASANFSQPASYALGFVVTGAFYVLVGGLVVLVMKNRLAKQQLVPPMTVQELRKDKQWLKSEL